ncbi:uncharacterized protein GGS22DRAFT_9354 [Annulohypoxylon maeteangense]|uniref:uncharacterized protein n=1 Tax=Annulohypoxylon maeteangense TaxID=1927788 RepID=UPI0020083E2F|nr:uncharacterized protein GGS22DRAFT_9354 [Annulohypoxylon maeteangense]KAI0890193.1 hypothetical protein GGS22DRAFT_9354 [Annulohypoxylon maeteangense]
MPKKRHNNKYSKPPSVAPPSLALSSSSRATEHHERSVNQLLAEMRRSSVRQNGAQNNVAAATPTVPPSIRQILQIPETPAPRPRRAPRRDANGRRAPPGPPPPRSWVSLALSRHAPKELQSDAAGHIQHWRLPDAYVPESGSLIDLLLRRLARDWEQQREWNQFYLYTLPSHLRTGLLTYVAEIYEPGLSIKDIRLILTGPSEEKLAEYDVDKPDLNILNGDIFYLDLAGSVGKSLTLRELSDLLFPPKVVVEQPDLQDSWETPEPIPGPVRMLPNLTRLSLAIDPEHSSNVSWKQLLLLANKMPTLTHLNLSGWPEPSLTPNAKLARIISPVTGRSVQYGGTGPYSHNLDNDWVEAILILKRLSKALYGLEYLDLTGCGDWFPALMKTSDGDFTVDYIDWVGDWGKITTLRLYSGYALTDDSTSAQISRFAEWIESATAVGKHIRTQRSGKGRWITVDKDTLSESAEAALTTRQLGELAWGDAV